MTVRSLRAMGVRTGLISNSDVRIGAMSRHAWGIIMCSRHIVDALKDLGISEYLSPILISEAEHVEKPSISIFLAACARGGATPIETLHVGDDFRE